MKEIGDIILWTEIVTVTHSRQKEKEKGNLILYVVCVFCRIFVVVWCCVSVRF